MNKIRILFCIDSLAPDAGTERQLAELVSHIDKDRFNLHLCCFEDSPRFRELAAHSTTLLFPIVSVYRPNGLRQIRRLRRYLRDHHIDIIQTFMIKANIVGTLAARNTPARIITSRRNLGYSMTPFYFRVFRFLDRYATRILANSEGAKTFVAETERVPPSKIDVLYNAVDIARYAPDRGDPAVPKLLGIPDHAKVVGIVANLKPVKGHVYFLRAAKTVAERVPDAAFLIVGRGTLRPELARIAADLGIADKVFFADDHGSVPDHLRRMAVGCLASESEGFSNAILEYMAAGLPVVATNVGGNAEAVRQGQTGFLVPYADPDAMAQPLIELLTDEPRRAAMGANALRFCREHFALDSIVRQHEDYYIRIAQQTQ